MSDLNQAIITALENLKGKNIVTLDVRELSDVMDTLVIASGTSSRHARSLAENLVEETKNRDFGRWVLKVSMPVTGCWWISAISWYT